MSQAKKCPIVSIIKTMNAIYQRPKTNEEIAYIEFIKSLVELNVTSVEEIDMVNREKLLSLYTKKIDKFDRQEAIGEAFSELDERFILLIDKKLSFSDFSILLENALFNYYSQTIQADITAQVDIKLAAINDSYHNQGKSYYYV